MAADELVELKFRLADGSDIGPSKYNSSATVTSLKEKIIAQWPKDKENGPKSVNDIKLINAGRILENNRTLAESRLPLSEVPGGVITMHVVVRPPVATSHARRSRRSDAAAMTTEYPPPIPLLAHMENVSSHVPWVMNSYRTSDGRLVITEERAPRHEYFQVLRSDGRLVLNRFQGECGGFRRENQHWG